MTLDSASLLAFLINSAVQTAIIAGGTAAALRLVRTASASVKYRICVAGLALCGAVPLLTAWPAARVDGAAIVAPVDTSAIADSDTASLLVCGYLTLVLWNVAMLTRAALVSIGLRRSSTPITDGPILAAFQRCNIPSRDIRLCCSPRVTTPLVCGVARPAIVFPNDFTQSDRDVIDAVIAHECAHVARHDLAVTVMIEILTVLFAAHPAVAALKRVAGKHREVACDEAAIARLRLRRTTYAFLLMRIADRRTNVVRAVAHGAGARLEARIRDLLDVQSNRRASFASHVLVYLCLVTPAVVAPLTTIAVNAGWAELSGVWTLDVDQSRPRGRLPFRAARLRIDATNDRVHVAQQRTRRNGVEETFEIRRTTDDVPSDITLPWGMVVRTRARWDGRRLVTNSSAPKGGWREHAEAIATRNRLVIRYENVTGDARNRYEFVFRRE
jgi:beta-lactamase regulating signal transducer with metallopeptidase domain